MNILEYNRDAWNKESAEGSEWGIPVTQEIIAEAKKGNWRVFLTPVKETPADWFGNIQSKQVLCLASGGGQQAPILAAAGAKVVSFDLSDVQLGKDQMVAARDNLDLITIQGDMADLSQFSNQQFDLIFNPASNLFVPDLRPVWQECSRVLKPGGKLLSGFMNPCYFLFDHYAAEEAGELKVCYKLPVCEPVELDEVRNKIFKSNGHAIEFAHSLEAQIGGQITAGFTICGLYEDYWSDDATLLNRYSPTSIASLASIN